jgi:hypothetical protein
MRPRGEGVAMRIRLLHRAGFDIIDDGARSREIIARTLKFLKARLH